MFRTIPAMKMKPWIILKPFAADTWYMIVVIVVMLMLCVLVVDNLGRILLDLYPEPGGVQ